MLVQATLCSGFVHLLFVAAVGSSDGAVTGSLYTRVASKVEPQSGGMACGSNWTEDSFWNHSKCSGTKCCNTYWGAQTAASCCLQCGATGIGSEPCVAWEWTADADTCYVCTKAVLPFREFMTGHTTGCVGSAGECSAADHTVVHRPPATQGASPVRVTQQGMTLGNGTFLLDGQPTRLFAGSLQHFRMHPNHWEHRLKLAKHMGLNAVQTLIPWFLMEPTPDAFVTDGFCDIVKFGQLCAKLGLKIVLRPGPFICDGPDFGGLPWWLAQQGTAATTLPGQPAFQLRVRTSDHAYMHRVELFYTKLFRLLRSANLTAGQGGPIVMAQIENEYGSYGSDKAYLGQLRDIWRKGLGDGVVIHSTDGPSEQMLLGTRIEGVLNTIDGDPNFDLLRTIQPWAQPVMNSEVYTGGLAMWGNPHFPSNSIDIAPVVDAMLSKNDTAGVAFNASFTLWLFAGVTDFGFQGGSTQRVNYLTPSYDFGSPVTESGVLRPQYAKLQTVLAKHGALVGSGPPPPPPPVASFPLITMTEVLPLLDTAVLAGLAPQPIVSATPRGMEELGIGYGYALYTTTVPEPQASNKNVGISLAGMHDRALIVLDKEPKLLCEGSFQVCGSASCGPVPTPPNGSTGGCPDGFFEHASGYWANSRPHTNATQPAAGVAACGKRCSADAQCVAFEVYDPTNLQQCHTFDKVMAPPFTPYANMLTCVKNSSTAMVAAATSASTIEGIGAAPVLDLLVENRGRSCYGNGMVVPTTGIDRWVQADGQALPGWTIFPLGTMANVSGALAPLWGSISGTPVAPAFYRGNFSIAAGHVADTYINLQGWGKGMAYINGHALARYYHIGPQFTHYCPGGFLREGSNELILFETVYPKANRSVSFMAQHLRL